MIYDLTQIFNELDLLEIRLNILDEHVDWFVIGESTQTFSGKPKPLYYLENKDRFEKWNHKIKHIVIPEMTTNDVYERTSFQKDYLRKALIDCDPEDVIYYGDVDEIWKPQLLDGKLQQLNYCYYLNQRSSEDWQGTNRCIFKDLPNLNSLRANHDRVLKDGGWHFTNCMGYDNIVKKLESYDHQEFNTDEVKARLRERMENGEDYVGRSRDWQGFPFEFWQSEIDLPEFLIKNKDAYKHLFK